MTPPAAGKRQPGRPATPLPLGAFALALLLLGAATAVLYAAIASRSSDRFSVSELAPSTLPPPLLPPLPPPPPPPPLERQQPPPSPPLEHQQQPRAGQQPSPRRPLWYFAPFFSGSGMGQEALAIVLGLARYTAWGGGSGSSSGGSSNSPWLWISSHGDVEKAEVYFGLPPEAQRTLLRLARAGARATMAGAAIILCHSEPGAWALPEPLYLTALCPPIPLEQAAYVVARTMFEAELISPMHAARCNQMREVWVPTAFHRASFIASGVQPAKLRVVPEPVDVDEFDPSQHEPLPLPLGSRVFGPAQGAAAGAAGAGAAAAAGEAEAAAGAEKEQPFVFLSIFKWEARKGWDVLLHAYLRAFTAADNVQLLLLTQPFHSESDFGEQMRAWAARELGGGAAAAAELPTVHVLDTRVDQADLPRLYRTADCFVLPTRGEGWGLPIVEAMSMSLPVIATNWSGPTAYLDETVGYPLPIEGLADSRDAEGAFKGLRWAQPSVDELARLMRHVLSHRQEAAVRGRAARQRMAERYSPQRVAETVAVELARIEGLLDDQGG